MAMFEQLDAANVRGDYQPFFTLIAECVEQSFAVYCRALGVGST
jgi:hypothetical protein